MSDGRDDIKTVHEYPPIPRRDWDWYAYHDGDEESNHKGWGSTEQGAIEDLLRLDQERDEYNDGEELRWMMETHHE